jgi:prepilin-type N-terminal cleavage/methylation domain-containing protein
MPLSVARKRDRGFTLIELLVIISIVGILTAIGIPSFLSMLDRQKVENAVVKVESALRGAQRTAMKNSKDCIVTIPIGIDSQLTSNCLDSSDWSISDIDLTRPSGLATLTFDFKGRINNPGNQGIIVLSLPDGSMPQKCLEISTGIGLMRSGNYDGSNCNTP